MDAKEEEEEKITGGKREGVINTLLNAGAEYMNMGSGCNQGEKIEYVIAV